MDEQILKYFLSELTDEERQDLFERIETDRDLKDAFLSVKKIQSYSQLAEQPSDRELGRDNYDLFAKRYLMKKQRRLMTTVFRYVAVVAVIVGLASLAFNKFYLSKDNLLTFSSSPDAPATMELGDGTVVWLNANSSLVYPSEFKLEERMVKLEGEGYFDVAKDTDRPFVVAASGLEVRVIGTQFSVNSFSDNNFSQVTLVDGSVEVKINGVPYSLNPGQQLQMDNDSENIEIREVNVMDFTWWKDGIYTFRSVKLEEVLRVAEEWFEVEFVFVNSSARDMIFNGALLRAESLDSFIGRIEATSSCRFVKRDNIIEIY